MTGDQNVDKPPARGSLLWRLACENPFEAITAFAALATLVIAVITLSYLRAELEGLRDTLESQSYSYIITGLSDYDRVLIENAELMPYLEGDPGGRELPLPAADSERTARIMALANYKLDFMDGFYSQAPHINWARYTRCGWEIYFHQSFERSPALCTLICNNHAQYGTRVSELGLAVCQRTASVQGGTCGETAAPIPLPQLTADCLAQAGIPAPDASTTR